MSVHLLVSVRRGCMDAKDAHREVCSHCVRGDTTRRARHVAAVARGARWRYYSLHVLVAQLQHTHRCE